MKVRPTAILAAAIAATTRFLAFAATETVDGIEWTYAVSGAKASVYSSSGAAIPAATAGAIAIPQSLGGCAVTGIGYWAFRECRAITDVTIPDGVKSVGDCAFYDCSGLKTVNVGAGVSSIGSSAFYGCGALESFSVAAGNSSYSSVDGLLLSNDGKTLAHGVNGDVVIPDGVESVKADAFAGLGGLTSVDIPGSVAAIGPRAFEACRGLTEVAIPEGVAEIGYSAFSGCENLANVTIPKSVASIGHKAFDGCADSLYDEDAPSGVLQVDGWVVGTTGELSGALTLSDVRGIGDEAFYGAKGLSSVTFPEGLTVIGNSAFCLCSGLVRVTIPNSVTTIGDNAFRSCTGLESLTIGSGVTSIGEDAFKGCTNLAHVTILSDAANVRSYVFFAGQKSVMLDANGGNPAFQKVLVEMCAEAGELPVATRDRHLFLGWFTKESGGTQVTDTTNLRANATYYAHWRYVGSADESHIYIKADDAYETEQDGTFLLGLSDLIESYSEPRISVSGLPSGLKFSTSSGQISGKATKPGEYAVKVSVTNATVSEPVVKVFKLTVPNLEWDPAAVGAALEDSYLLQAGIPPDLHGVTDAVKGAGWKLSVSGLPSGVKFNSSTLAFSGIASKEGKYTVYFTATKDKAKQVATTTFEVVFPTLKLETKAYAGALASGEVKGAGKYPFGKKVTLKATPAKGSVFVGWFKDDAPLAGTADYRAASYPYVTTDSDVTLVAKFATSAEDKASIELSADGEDIPVSPDKTPTWTNRCGVALERFLSASALSVPTVKASGLPSGVKLVQDMTTKAYSLSGAPKSASKAGKGGDLTPAKVKLTVSTSGKSSQAFNVNWVILPLPEWAQGSFAGAAWTDDDDVEGVIQSLSVSAAGKISGKLAKGDGTWTLSAPYYDSCDDEGSKFQATVVGKNGKAQVAYAVDVTAEDFGDVKRGVATCAEWTAWQNLWKTEPLKTEAKKFSKAPVLTLSGTADGLPSDGDTVTLKFAATGMVTASGKFASKDAKGKDIVYSASCTAPLIPETPALGSTLFLYFPAKAGKFAGHAMELSLDWDGAAFKLR